MSDSNSDNNQSAAMTSRDTSSISTSITSPTSSSSLSTMNNNSNNSSSSGGSGINGNSGGSGGGDNNNVSSVDIHSLNIIDEKETKKQQQQQVWFHELSEKLQLLSQSNDALQEKNLNLVQQQNQSELKIDTYKQELDSKNLHIQMLENKVKELNKSNAHKEDEIKKLRFQNEELLQWKDTHKITEEDYARVKEALRVKDVNIDSLTIQLEHATNRNAMLSENLRDLGDRTSLFDRDESFNISSASKQLLDYQKMLAYHKIKAVEEKYATIKNINLGYQRTLQEQALEIEKYKYVIQNQNR